MTNENIREKLSKITSNEPSKWMENAKWRKENKAWLKKSQSIALRVLRTLRERKMQQKELAKMLGVSDQQISKIVKGKENLTLETITKLEQALEISLFEIPIERKLPEVDLQRKQFNSEFKTIKTHFFYELKSSRQPGNRDLILKHLVGTRLKVENVAAIRFGDQIKSQSMAVYEPKEDVKYKEAA